MFQADSEIYQGHQVTSDADQVPHQMPDTKNIMAGVTLQALGDASFI